MADWTENVCVSDFRAQHLAECGVGTKHRLLASASRRFLVMDPPDFDQPRRIKTPISKLAEEVPGDHGYNWEHRLNLKTKVRVTTAKGQKEARMSSEHHFILHSYLAVSPHVAAPQSKSLNPKPETEGPSEQRSADSSWAAGCWFALPHLRSSRNNTTCC